MAKQIKKSVSPKCNHLDSTNPQAKTAADETQRNFIECLHLDDTSKQMAQLKAIIFDTPDNNQTKIQFIKEELSADRYQIHSDHIASKLLEYAALKEPAEIA